MLKILPGNQVKALDAHYLLQKGISSWELMERAASAFVNWWEGRKFPKGIPILIFCGAGNNGGDGFAIARLLYQANWSVQVVTCFSGQSNLSVDTAKNYSLLPNGISILDWKEVGSDFHGILIDAILGVGWTGPLRSETVLQINKINSLNTKVISVDLPTGLPSDGILEGNCVQADITVSFAFPKLSLLLPEHAKYTGELVVEDIGIDETSYAGFPSHFFYLRKHDIKSFHKDFTRFSHKGDFGKVLIIGGSPGKMGAVVLSSKSALRTGSGLVSVMVGMEERMILQVAVPEAMCRVEEQIHYEEFDAIGVGPGLGTDGSLPLLQHLLENYSKPIVLDADALNLLALNPELIPKIPKNSILTPHLGEFDRLFGKSAHQYERMENARNFCQKRELNLLIKGANSLICLADGRQIFNSSGSHYMATAGSGDVLTGMITSFLGQGYTPEQALICGVFHHGLAGEFAGIKKRKGTIASDIIEAIPDTFVQLDIP
jgi:NAD(P)H-hydrate epimerase